VIRLRVTSWLKGIAFLQRFRDFLSHGSSPRAVGILPCQTIVFPRCAKDSLCVLGHLRTIVSFLRVLVLCVVETPANLNGVEFILANTPI
jgi:hypothetical protein